MTTDTEAAGIGHNAPPSPIDEMREKVNEFGRAAQQWGETGVQTDADAERLNDFLAGARQIHKDLDAMRVAEKKPHDDAAKAVQAKFKPLLDAIERAGAAAKGVLSAYMRRKEAQLAEQRRREAEEAARIEAEAQAKAAEAEARGDLVGAAEAEAAAAVAKAEADAATDADAAKARVQSASGAGRTTGMRTFRIAKIVNSALAVAHYRNHPEVLATIERLANADIRASRGAAVSIPGVDVIEERRVA